MGPRTERCIAVYCCADDAYIYPSIVALDSLRRFHPELDYFVIGNRSAISPEKIALLEALGITFLHSEFNTVFKSETWPNTVYLSLFGPEIFHELGYKYSLSLDGDTLCISHFDLNEVFRSTVHYAGIVNYDPWWSYFGRSEFVKTRWNFSEEQLLLYSTNTGVVFWNNNSVMTSGLGHRAVACYKELIENDVYVMGDQALFALAAMIEPHLTFTPLDHTYNYRVGNDTDMKLSANNVKILHFTGHKPWVPWQCNSWRDWLRKPRWLKFHKQWQDYVKRQRYFTPDLSLRSDMF